MGLSNNDVFKKLSTKLHQAVKSLGIDSVLLSNKIEKSAKKLVKSILKKKAVTAKKVNKPLVSSVAIKKSIQTKPLKTAATTSPAKPKVSASKPKASTPKPKTSPNYSEMYTEYLGEKPKYVSKGTQLGTFFNSVVTPNYDTLKELTVELDKQLTQYPTGNITMVIDSSCSAPATKAYNVELSKRRIESIIKFFNETELLKKYITAQRLILKPGTAAGENAQVQQFDSEKGVYIDGKTVSCTDNDPSASGGDTKADSKEIFTTTAMACRRAYIASITGTLTAPVPTPVPETQEVLVGNVVTSTVKVPVVEQVRKERNNVTKRVLRSLLSECDYFETIKAETPMVYDNLKDKLKFFQPAFHSTTPEGLNARLTFLQQCLRPGNTIPIKGLSDNSDLNARNTTFGPPPVCVLRVGDFYNSKVVIRDLNITFEENTWDFAPILLEIPRSCYVPR